MPETPNSTRPNFLSRFRNPAFGVGIGSAALLLALTHSGPSSQHQALSQPVGSNTKNELTPVKKNIGAHLNALEERPVTTSRSGERAKLTEQCWDGDVSDLNHVTKVREKKALANIALACEIIAEEKWYKLHPTQEINCLVEIWDRESGWDENARSKTSSAGGIPQATPMTKMKSAGKDWATNPATQIKWGIGYINDRYKTPCGALEFWDGHNWY